MNRTRISALTAGADTEIRYAGTVPTRSERRDRRPSARAIALASFLAASTARADDAAACEDAATLEAARCFAARGDGARAVASLARYVAEGGAEKVEAERQIALLEPRLVHVEVVSDVAGIELRVDGECPIDAASFTPSCSSNEASRVLLLNAGQRRLTAEHPRFRRVVYVFTMAPGGQLRVRLNDVRLHEPKNPYRDAASTAWLVAALTAGAGALLGLRTFFAREGIDSPLGVAAIGAGAGAVVAAGVATYFTVRASRWQPAPDLAAGGPSVVGFRRSRDRLCR